MTKKYGNEKTNLDLTAKALAVYSGEEIDIYEHIVEDEDGNKTYTYTMHGIIEADGITEDEVNKLLEDLGDQLAELD